MPTSDDPDVLVDTSVAVALTLRQHEHHDAAVSAMGERRLGLAGHAAFETFSVLTRLPPPARRPPEVVSEIMSTNFPANRYLSARAAAGLLSTFRRGQIAGGAVYDGLVGAVAAEHSLTLATLDERALDIYRILGIEVEHVPT